MNLRFAILAAILTLSWSAASGAANGGNQTVARQTQDAGFGASIHATADVPEAITPEDGTDGAEVKGPTRNDTTPPAAITTLAAVVAGNASVQLTWTAPGDDGNSGTATSYQVRYATSPILQAGWASATPVTGLLPAPEEAGSVQSVVISGLNPANQTLTLHFAIIAVDELDNAGAVSNSPAATFQADLVAPAVAGNFSVAGVNGHTVRLSWVAPGDDGSTGQASSYQVRFSTLPILDEAGFQSATPVGGTIPTPALAGTTQQMDVIDLPPGLYHFAMRAMDDVQNAGGLALQAGGPLPNDGVDHGAGGGCAGSAAGVSVPLLLAFAFLFRKS